MFSMSYTFACRWLKCLPVAETVCRMLNERCAVVKKSKLRSNVGDSS